MPINPHTKARLNITQEAGVACWCVCGWKDVGMVIRKSIAIDVVPNLFGYFFEIPSLYVLPFF